MMSDATLWLLATVAIYLGARALHSRARVAVLNPALVSITAVIVLLVLTRTTYDTYDRGGRIISFWLGPAIVALGVPLAAQLPLLRKRLVGIAIGLISGAAVGIVVAVGVAIVAGAPSQIARSLAPRSATTPIAVLVSARAGGIPALSAMVSIVSGAIGGAIGVPLLRAARVRSPLATGLALGAAAHGLGTARAADEGAVEGAAAGMAMGVVGVLTAVLAPPLLSMTLRALGR